MGVQPLSDVWLSRLLVRSARRFATCDQIAGEGIHDKGDTLAARAVQFPHLWQGVRVSQLAKTKSARLRLRALIFVE